MNDTTYNGWTNYPTWCVHLWLTNDPDTQFQSEDLVRNIFARSVGDQTPPFYPETTAEDVAHAARSDAADALQEWVDESLTHSCAGMNSDLVTWALGQVNWYEIARAFLEDAS